MTKHRLFISVAFVSACIGCSFAAPARAQEATRMRSDHAITLDAGLDSAFITRLGYSYRGDWLGADSRIYARFSLPIAAPDFGDFAFDAGARLHLYDHANWGVQLLAGPVIRHTDDPLFASTALGVRALLLPGYQSDRWGLMFDLGFEQMLATQIQQSSYYKRTFYAQAKSGWYALSGGTLHAGLRGGVLFGRVELSAAAGVMTDGSLRPKTPPIYLTLGSAYSL